MNKALQRPKPTIKQPKWLPKQKHVEREQKEFSEYISKKPIGE